MDGWNTFSFPFGMPIFRGELLVLGSVYFGVRTPSQHASHHQDDAIWERLFATTGEGIIPMNNM